MDLEALINGQIYDCDKIPTFPYRIWGSVYSVLYAEADDKTPLICGGMQNEAISNQCFALYKDAIVFNDTFTLKNETFEWINSTPMNEARIHASSVSVLEAGMTSEYNWWVSGGLNEKNEVLQSSEIRWTNGSWGVGPKLPHQVFGHCVVQIERGKSLVIGGNPFHDNYQYNWITKVN